MSVIEELASKLRGAKRASAKARRDWDEAVHVSADLRKELERRDARVVELDRAISLLRNGLTTKTTETIGSNVTALKPR